MNGHRLIKKGVSSEKKHSVDHTAHNAEINLLDFFEFFISSLFF